MGETDSMELDEDEKGDKTLNIKYFINKIEAQP